MNNFNHPANIKNLIVTISIVMMLALTACSHQQTVNARPTCYYAGNCSLESNYHFNN